MVGVEHNNSGRGKGTPPLFDQRQQNEILALSLTTSQH